MEQSIDLVKEFNTLAINEQNAAKNVFEQLGPVEDSQRWESLAQDLILSPRNKIFPNIAANRGRWGCAIEDVPLIRQLLIYPTLIVDLSPYTSENDLINSFGLNINQLLMLADNGHLMFNVYQFDSQRKKNFIDYIKSPEIIKFLRHPNCRIHSIRRKYFFESIAISDEFTNEIRNTGFDLFNKPIQKLSQENPQALKIITRFNDVENALKVITEAYLYVNIFGCQKDNITNWLKNLDKYLTNFNLIRTLQELRGLKSSLATPYTAAFGGFSTYSEIHVERMLTANWIMINKINKGKIIDPTITAGLMYLQTVLQNLNIRDDFDVQVPKSIENDSLQNFMHLLQDNKQIHNDALGFLEQVRIHAGNNNEVLNSLERWTNLIEQIYKSYKRTKSIIRGTGTLMGGVTGYGCGILTGGDPGMSKLILAGLGSIIGAELSKASEDYLIAKMLSDNKCQIIDRYEKIKKLKPSK